MRRRTDGRGRGFTLIELLVVIAIISLLLSILMPSLQKAKLAAKKIQCLASMKNTHIAFELYAGNWNGVWPAIWYHYGHSEVGGDLPLYGKYTDRWHNALAQYADVDPEFAQYGQYVDINDLPERAKWQPAYRGRLGCPSMGDTRQSWDQYYHFGWFGYGMNQHLPPTQPANPSTDRPRHFATGDPAMSAGDTRGAWLEPEYGPHPTSKDPKRGNMVKRPGGTVLLADTNMWFIFWKSSIPVGGVNWGKLSYRHLDAVNVLFCDGHAESYTMSRITPYEYSDYRSEFLDGIRLGYLDLGYTDDIGPTNPAP